MPDDKLPAAPSARKLTKKEAQALTDEAFALERRIKAAWTATNVAGWALAEALYDFHERGAWRLVGYDTLEDFLGQPELGISRSAFFRAVQLWRDLVIVREIPAETLAPIELTKVAEVAPAIRKGEVVAEDALDDAAGLSRSDLRIKYGRSPGAGTQKPDDSVPLAAEQEPARVRCNVCGSWYVPEEPEAEGRLVD